jgi:hypothetical protein
MKPSRSPKFFLLPAACLLVAGAVIAGQFQEPSELSDADKKLFSEPAPHPLEEADRAIVERTEAIKRRPMHSPVFGPGGPQAGDLTIDPQPLTEQDPDAVLYTVFISEAMGQAAIDSAIKAVKAATLAGYPSRLVVRGMLPDETFREGMARIVERITALDAAEAHFQVDPPAFTDNFIAEVPTIIRTKGGKVTDRVVGTTNPVYLANRFKETSELESAPRTHTRAGTTVEISEVDLIEWMKERIANQDWSNAREKMVDRYWANKKYVTLPPARKSQTRKFDPSILIHDDFYIEGTLVYPKGTKLSPFDAAPIVGRYAIFNPTREEEVKFIMGLVEKDGGRPWTLIATEFPQGDGFKYVQQLQDQVRSVVYLLDNQVKERFKLAVTPSLVVPVPAEKVFSVQEVALEK